MNNIENKNLRNISSRVKVLRRHYNLSLKQFSLRAGISHVAIFNIESGKTNRPHPTTLKSIISVYGTTYEWLYYGIGDMLPNGRNSYGNINGKDVLQIENHKRQSSIELIKKNRALEIEVERLWKLLDHLTQR